MTQAMVELLRQLAYKKRIWVVGDVRQAIHHWRGASLKSLQKFDVEFKAHAAGTSIQRYPLAFNRRSSQEVVDLNTTDLNPERELEEGLDLDMREAELRGGGSRTLAASGESDRSAAAAAKGGTTAAGSPSVVMMTNQAAGGAQR